MGEGRLGLKVRRQRGGEDLGTLGCNGGKRKHIRCGEQGRKKGSTFEMSCLLGRDKLGEIEIGMGTGTEKIRVKMHLGLGGG